MSPYNTSLTPLRRMEKYLRSLQTRRQTMSFAADEPDKLAYQLREAIYASDFHENYAHFSKLSDFYRFESRPGHVRAVYLGPANPEIVDDKGEEDGDTISEDLPGLPEEHPVMEVEDVQNLPGVVGAALRFSDDADELHFPNAILVESQKSRLFKFCEEHGWYIIDHEDGGLTLTRKDISPDIRWKPNE